MFIIRIFVMMLSLATALSFSMMSQTANGLENATSAAVNVTPDAATPASEAAKSGEEQMAEVELPPYVRLIYDEDDITQTVLPDSIFNRIAGRTIFKVNRTELNTKDPFVIDLNERILPYANEKGWMLVGIDLRGAASPEGPYDNNVRLSIGRAAALRKHMSQKLDSVSIKDINTRTVAEDYAYLLWLLEQDDDPAAPILRDIIERQGITNEAAIKKELREYNWGTLWNRLLNEYFPTVRAARVVLLFREIHPKKRPEKVETPLPEPPMFPIVLEEPVIPFLYMPITPGLLERPHAVALSTNVLYDAFWMPGFGWAPMPNISLEWFPRKGNWTLRAGFMSPYYHKWDKHKFFQIRDYHLEVRRYFKPGFHHLGPYAALYVNNTKYGIGLSDKRGWQGEAVGGALKLGWVLPLKDSRWHVDFHIAAGAWLSWYDPYIYGNPLTGQEDGLYYYKWFGKASEFRRRNHRMFWVGPTEIGITFSYDVLFYRLQKSGASFRRYEPFNFE